MHRSYHQRRVAENNVKKNQTLVSCSFFLVRATVIEPLVVGGFKVHASGDQHAHNSLVSFPRGTMERRKSVARAILQKMSDT